MAIEINKPLVISDKQIFVFENIVIANVDGEKRADITFAIKGEDGQRISEKVLSYTGEDFNTFWANFNSGKFLYEELVRQEDLKVSVDNDLDEEFINVIIEE